MPQNQTGTGYRGPRLRTIMSWLISTIALFLVALAGWIRFHFGAVSFEQIVNNLPISSGEGVGNNDLLHEAIVVCIVVPATLTTLAFAGRWVWRRKRGARPPLRRRHLIAPTLALVVALSVLLTVAGVPQFAAAQLDPRTIADYYRTPAVTSAPAKPRNLITIYLESTENTWRDTSIFGENLLANLDAATAGWPSYETLQQYPTGGWTMAGIVGTECGFALKSKLLTIGVNSNVQGEQVESYLPGATCLGDVLEAQGYTNAYVGGANVRFGGKDTYLTDHGYTSIEGREKWESQGEDPSDISIWGLSDARLFVHAKDTLERLRKTGTPYNLTLLTMDNHEPAAVFPSCTDDETEPMATALKCSGKAVAGFLAYLEDTGVLDDTVVMLMGDHVKNTGDSDQFRTELENAPERTIFFRVHSPDQVRFTRENADQLSVLPTTLELLGFGVRDGRAGLGVSFVGNHALTGTAEELPAGDYATLLAAPSSKIYQLFWQS